MSNTTNTFTTFLHSVNITNFHLTLPFISQIPIHHNKIGWCGMAKAEAKDLKQSWAPFPRSTALQVSTRAYGFLLVLAFMFFDKKFPFFPLITEGMIFCLNRILCIGSLTIGGCPVPSTSIP